MIITTSPSIYNQQRLFALDFLRGWAVFLMILCHSIRGIHWDSRPDWMRYVMAMEPLGQVLFLFLLGLSLYFSMQKYQDLSNKQWVRKIGVRVAGLWGLSVLLILLERGSWQSWVNLQGGFLGLAAKSTLVLSMLFLFPVVRRFAMALVLGLGFGVATLLPEWSGYWINGWNAGNGPLFPLVGVAWLGWMAGFSHGSKTYWQVSASLFLMLLGWLLAGQPLGLDWWETSGRYSMGVLFYEGGQAQDVYYYSLRTSMALFWSGLTALLWAALKSLEKPFLGIISLFGRHSLGVYCAHLALLGGVRLQWGLLQGNSFYALWLGILLSMVVFVYGSEGLKAQRL